MTERKKLTPPQEKAVAEMREYGLPFRVFAPKYLGRFGTTRAHYAPRHEDYVTAKNCDFKFRWATYEALERSGVVSVLSRFAVDATEPSNNPMRQTGRVAQLSEAYAND